jgi:hypothetical protein
MAEFTKPVVLSLYSAERSLTLSPMAAYGDLSLKLFIRTKP